MSEVIGGKSGGKEPTRTGSGAQPERTDEAVAVAEKWFKDKLKL